MLKMLGAVLVVLGTGSLGVGAIGRMKREVQMLRAFITALEGMEREISFQLTPMPALFWGLATRNEEPLSGFFATLSRAVEDLGEHDLSQRWKEGLRALPLSQRTQELLGELGDVLGRYDAESQCHAIAHTREELATSLQKLEGEGVQKRKLYVTLALTVGALLVILLL